MNEAKLVASKFIALILTILVLRELLRIISGEHSTPIIPGWSFSYYPTEWELSIGASILLAIAMLIYGFYKLCEKVVSSLLTSFREAKKMK